MPTVRLTPIGALLATGEPDLFLRAKAQILKALDEAEGNRTDAAAALGVTRMCLTKWIDRLDAWGDVDQLCTAKGYTVHPGPTRASAKAKPRKKSQ